MASTRRNLSLPHMRQKAALQARKLTLRVQIAQRKEALREVSTQLAAMSPPKKEQ